MRYSALKAPKSTRQIVDVFRGYNHNLKIKDGEFWDMMNLSSDEYPVLTPRKSRGIYAKTAAPQGIVSKGELCYVDGKEFVIGENRYDMNLSVTEKTTPKEMISMGAYVIILPDRKYINTMNPEDRGDIENRTHSTEAVSFQMCDATGQGYENAIVSATAPETPEDLQYWMDTSSSPHALKRWSKVSEQWVSIETTYVKMHSSGIGKGFSKFDGVKVSGITIEQLSPLNGSQIIQDCGDDYIVLTGVLDNAVSQEDIVRIERAMPVMDFLCENDNRLWGCRYGLNNDGEMVNEIYSCKLGDFRNWQCYQGISTDSYAASCGTDGPFTGAITHLGSPLFFKENCIHKVLGNVPSNFQIQTTACRGVQSGCEHSLAIVNEVLYYKSRSGICAFDGSLPVDAGYCLGKEPYFDASAGAHGSKYYISMRDANNEWSLFVYDTSVKLWHREDNLRAVSFCSHLGEMYCVDVDTLEILCLTGGGTAYEGKVHWMAESGEQGVSTPDTKYISRINIRLQVPAGSVLKVSAQYDADPEWVELCSIRGTDLRSFSIPVRPVRCDHMKLRFEGVGQARIYSIAKTIDGGSDYQ